MGHGLPEKKGKKWIQKCLNSCAKKRGQPKTDGSGKNLQLLLALGGTELTRGQGQ